VKNERYSTFSFVSIEFVLHPSDFVGSSKKLLVMSAYRNGRFSTGICRVLFDMTETPYRRSASQRTSGHAKGKAGLARGLGARPTKGDFKDCTAGHEQTVEKQEAPRLILTLI
jgi:hypothetical protein